MVRDRFGKATASVTVPEGALPAGTKVTIATAADRATLQSLVPKGQGYVTAFTAGWVTPSGTSPEASAPVTMTVEDPAIHRGNRVYELTGTAVKLVGIATVDGAIELHFTADPSFVVAVLPRLHRVARTGVHASALLRVAAWCDGGVACTGTATIVAPHAAHGAAVVVARGPVALGAGRGAIVDLHLTAAGRRLLDRLGHHETATILTVHLTGGHTSNHVVRI